MTAKLCNGVSLDRLAAPSTDGHNGASATGAPPSTDGHNGASATGAPPSPNDANGRDERDRFAKLNLEGPGNPFARRMAAMRRAVHQTVTDEDLQAVTRQLIEKAKGGDVAAARLLFAPTQQNSLTPSP